MSILSTSRPAATTRGTGHGHGVSMPRALLMITLLAALVILPAIEAGSWFLTRIQLEDDAASAAVIAADEVERLPQTPDTAQTAFDIASQELARSKAEIDPATLRLLGGRHRPLHRTPPSPVDPARPPRLDEGPHDGPRRGRGQPDRLTRNTRRHNACRRRDRDRHHRAPRFSTGRDAG